jgi:hypothetical protein
MHWNISSSFHRSMRSAALITLVTGATFVAVGQVVPATPPAAAAAANAETVQLSPFVIQTERDTGWSADLSVTVKF